MTAISVSAPFPILTDIDGSPLDAGHVYIGQPNLDPVAFPKSVYWDASLTTPAAQPIRTSGGYPVRNGSPARIYTDGDYSIRINNKNGTLVYSSPAATDRMDSALVGYDGGTVQDVLDAVTGPTGAASVGYTPVGAGAIATNVQNKLREVHVSLTDFGADRTGTSDINSALTKAVSLLALLGGGTIYGNASDIYRLDTDYTITTSNITIDLRGGKLVGNGWLKFSGENGINGDWTGALENVFFKNARVGSGAGSTTKTPFFLYCIDSGMENVHKHSYGDTGVNMFMCRRTHFKRMTIRGGKSTGPNFAALMLHCEDSTFQDMVALEGPFTYVYQIKGGENCRGIRCIGRDISAAGSVSTDYGFYIRGDSPWEASPTTGYSYPYPTGAWASADVQRATRNSYFEDCELINTGCNIAAFHAQEFVNSGFVRCIDAATSGAGFSAQRLANGNENGILFSRCKGKRQAENLEGAGVVVISNHPSKIEGVSVEVCEMEGYGYNGFLFRNASATTLGSTAKNCCGKNLSQYSSAFAAEQGSRILYIGNTAIDDRATKYHAYGFLSDSTCKSPIVDANTVDGFTIRPFAISRPAKFSANTPGEISLQTTSGVAVTGGFLSSPASGEAVFIEASLTGVDATGVVGAWKIAGLFKNVGGTVSQEGATQQMITAINPGTWGGVAFQIVSNSVRITISGKASTTINWTGDVRMTQVM